MKGLAFRKLGRTSSHRRALLRNLVTSLITHERISTTVAKAKEAQRVAEKIITKAKKANLGKYQQGVQARDFLFPNKLQPTYPRLLELATRYADRPGGYTRIHLHGHRQGDHAPRALLELVDGPGDLRMELTARAIAHETFSAELKAGEAAVNLASPAARNVQEWIADARFSPRTRANVERVTKFRGQEAATLLVDKAAEHALRLKARDQLDGGPLRVNRRKVESFGEAAPFGTNLTPPMIGQRTRAGRTPKSQEEWQPRRLREDRRNSVIRLGKGAFAKRQKPRVILPPEAKRASKRA